MLYVGLVEEEVLVFGVVVDFFVGFFGVVF